MGRTLWAGLPAQFPPQGPNNLARPRCSSEGHPFGEQSGRPLKVPVVYVTADGGATWSSRSLPNDGAIRAYVANNPVADSRFAFAPVNSALWKVYIGPYLYNTDNAGQYWIRSVPKPRLEPNAVSAIDFSSRESGIMGALPPGCLTGEECTPVLMRTIDGGHRWVPTSP
jgi:photosystem II stability/assembly factor-like uncharacterized protein